MPISPSRRWRPRLDSLFTRLLLMQAALFVVLGIVFGLYFYIERNTTIATLYADRWAPLLAAAANAPAAAPAAPSVLRRDDAPADAIRPAPGTPRYVVLRRELQARGVTVDDVRVSLGEAEPRFWLHVVSGRPPVWLGVTGRFIAADWSQRATLGLALATALLVIVSWSFTRRLTRPLERLRERIAAHAPGAGDEPPGLAGATAGSPEIVAIDAAYAGLRARLRQHERERAVLLAGVSHDLRSPLARIRMAAELLPESADASPRKAVIVRNVTAADRLIESFMDLARCSELAFDETVDLALAARAAVAAFERPEAELSVEAPAAVPWPHANRLLLERLIANLVDNALKHGRTPVRVRVSRSPAGDASIDVDDAGQGIDPALIEQMQEAFTRGDGSRAQSGSGLGLAIVRQVAARLGGDLAFARRDGGQRVTVRLRVRLP